jgi:hypothetical protein
MKKTFEDSDKATQVFDHADKRVVLEVHKLTGGWYASGIITAAVGYDESPVGVHEFWSITKPQSWGFGSRAEASKVRTQIKREIAARIDAKDFEGKFIKYA